MELQSLDFLLRIQTVMTPDEDYIYLERLGILIDGELTADGKMIRPPTQMEVKMANDDVARWKLETSEQKELLI